MKKLLLTSLLVLFLLFPLSNIWGKSKTTTAVILRYPVGARAIGMGEAFSALSDDVSAIYWNPGGLANLLQNEFSVFYLEGVVDTNFGFLGYARPTNLGTFGGSVSLLQGGKTTIYYFDGTTKNITTQNDYVLSLSYARKLKENFSLGGNIKSITSTLAERHSASGFAIDVGGLYKMENFSLGASLTNLGSEMKYKEEGDPLPLTLRVGGAYHGELLSNSFFLAFDLTNLESSDTKLNLGGEYWLEHTLALRGGYKLNRDLESFTLGLGFALDNLQIDYAFAPIKNLESQHRISFLIRFGKPQRVKRKHPSLSLKREN